MSFSISHLTLEISTFVDFLKQKSCSDNKFECYLRSGLGDPTSAKVLREAATAMQSVFPQYELIRFMKLTRFDKKAQVHFMSYKLTINHYIHC